MSSKQNSKLNITIVDAIMGAGKSQASITYMNEHKNQKYIYITPYLPEAARIKEGCPDLHFVEPSDEIKDFGFSKTGHTKYLIEHGQNIASTHQMFRLYTPEMLLGIAAKQYTLIIDEEVEVLKEDNEINSKDIEWLKSEGYLEKEEYGMLRLVKDDYSGEIMRPLFQKLKNDNLLELEDRGRYTHYFYWALPIELLQAFQKVIIMTYMFHGQELKYYLDIHGATYGYLGVKLCDDGLYRFDADNSYAPPYTATLKDKIHICDKEALNSIGDKRTALSGNWYKKASKKELDELKNNLYNYFHNFKDFKTSAEDRMWGSGKKGKYKIRGKGYSSGWVVFNEKATNKYRNKSVLAYPFNIFAKPVKMGYFRSFGITYDMDCFATSIMVQWIWRSAIRDGKDIWIYVPSKRMRTLLINWMDEVGNTYKE